FLFLGATVVVNGVTLTAITQAVTRSLLGGEPTVAEVYRHTFTRPLWSAIAAYLVTALLISTGIMFLILPGIFLGGVLSVTIPIIEQRRTVRAMAGSISLLREELVKGMIVFCFFMLVAGLLPLMFLLLQGGAGVGPFTPLLGAIVGAVTLPLGFTAHVLLYLSLRAKSGYTSAALEADLNPPPAE
nr:hypothetical protein [Gammaproteobacteria bacterium]NIT64764.1 hypothetical protein [Gammaproteobacteria bacterium]NIV21735.1 hypothetical protein [Gammaproteobacteria bacterium]NIY33344.1 hypothetical protein [Gammaproteobacteria bacterium]